MEHVLFYVLDAVVCLGLGTGLGYWLAPKSAPKPGVAAPSAPVVSAVAKAVEHAVERADSPFVVCQFVTKAGEVVATKRLRRETLTTPMLWGNAPYHLIAENRAVNRRTYERE